MSCNSDPLADAVNNLYEAVSQKVREIDSIDKALDVVEQAADYGMVCNQAINRQGAVPVKGTESYRPLVMDGMKFLIDAYSKGIDGEKKMSDEETTSLVIAFTGLASMLDLTRFDDEYAGWEAYFSKAKTLAREYVRILKGWESADEGEK